MSPVPVRRAAPAAPAKKLVNFGSLSDYSGGFTLPEGDYALEFNVMMEPQRGDTPRNFEARLGVMVTAHDLHGKAQPQDQFYSMGSKAAQAFAPDPDTGKGLIAVPDAPGGTLNNKTNWFLFLDSLYNSGLPEGILSNDFSVLDGVWVHTSNVPEPEERKSFAKPTGDAEAEARAPRLIPIVTEIKEGGKPWEGTGGIPEAGAAVAAPAPKPVVGRIAPKPNPARPVARPAPAPAVVEEAPAGDEAVMEAAINAMAEVLGSKPEGMTKLLLRSSSFKAVTKAAGAEMAQLVTEQFFNNDENLIGVLGSLGYKLAGSNVTPQQ